MNQMLRVFVLEYYHGPSSKYLQEYYTCPVKAAQACLALQEVQGDCQAELSTIFVNTSKAE